jgi:hypothetical protein
MHTIKIKIHADGRIESLTKGIEGSGCQGASSWLDELGEVEVDEPTEDFYREQDVFEEVSV